MSSKPLHQKRIPECIFRSPSKKVFPFPPGYFVLRKLCCSNPEKSNQTWMLRSSQPNTVNYSECISAFDFETREKPLPDAPGSSEGSMSHSFSFVFADSTDFFVARKIQSRRRGTENDERDGKRSNWVNCSRPRLPTRGTETRKGKRT